MSEEELRVLNRDLPDRTHDTQCSTPGTPSAKGLKVTETAAGARLKGRPAHWNGMVGSSLCENSEGINSGANFGTSDGAENQISRKIALCAATRKQAGRFHTASVTLSPSRAG